MVGALVLCDIEGAEGALFGDPLLLRRVHNSTVVIEVHEDAHPGMSRDLQRQFVDSHRIERVEQEPRSDDLLEFRPPATALADLRAAPLNADDDRNLPAAVFEVARQNARRSNQCSSRRRTAVT